MVLKRLMALLLVCVLLAGCATKPDGDLDDRDCTPSGPRDVGGSGDDALAVLAVWLVIDLTWFAGCEAVVGIHNHFHVANSHGGIYTAPDGTFSVGVPLGLSGEYQAQQQIAAGKDTVVFVPQTPGETVYGVTVLTKLEGTQAELSLQDFSNQTSADILGAGVAMTQVHAEDVQLGANPARLVIYRAQAPDAGAAEPDYYLMYFVKTRQTAGILSIKWPYECPRCASGPDSALRNMDPTLDSFLSSFELSSQAR